MKKLTVLFLVLAILSSLCLTGCGLFGGGNDEIYEIFAVSKPTRTTTEVSYVTTDGLSLSGFYVTSVEGNNTIFDYEYQRLAYPSESLDNGERVKTVKGVINYKDGVYTSGEGGEWVPGTGTAFDLKLNLDKKLLNDVVISEDGTMLTANVTPENAVNVIGTNLNANGNISLTVKTNGVNLTAVEIGCTTDNATIAIRTSYTYNVQNLFPEQAAE